MTALALACMACSTPPEAGIDAEVVANPQLSAGASTFYELLFPTDQATTAARIETILAPGEQSVAAFFGLAWQQPYGVLISSTRQDFDASFPAEWQMPPTACWMVASGVADRLLLLSPDAWTEEACEHDPADTLHVENLLLHELVHVFHGQHHPSRDFDYDGVEEIGWFIEGLAVYASGQLEEGHVAEAAEAIEQDLAPSQLEDAWSGRYRYGVSGSLVSYLDQTFGRALLRQLMSLHREAEILGAIGVTEAELLPGWHDWVGRQTR